MDTDPLSRFLQALPPAKREAVEQLPEDRQEAMASEWERRLSDDVSLLTVSELDPHAAEARAAEEVAGEGL
ncbi:hypothetical protein AB0B01_30690 [Streptomyces sp. NPDC044571]|uniref:hypothetical protein n=1 Tax=Streptomyces sp. NPDC044571 TaxID=3155371 RepID=UPI0033FDA81D